VNVALNNFSFAATLAERRGVFIDTGDLIRLWPGPRRVFLPTARQSVVASRPLGCTRSDAEARAGSIRIVEASLRIVRARHQARSGFRVRPFEATRKSNETESGRAK
jgi:hypothetical protein